MLAGRRARRGRWAEAPQSGAYERRVSTARRAVVVVVEEGRWGAWHLPATAGGRINRRARRHC